VHIAAPVEDAAAQHQHAKEVLQLTEWMAVVGQGDKDTLVRHAEAMVSLHVLLALNRGAKQHS
jgi:hypothetical protein